MMAHALASTTLTDFRSVSRPLHTLLGFSLCTSCQQFNCCRCTNLFNFWPVREFLVDNSQREIVKVDTSEVLWKDGKQQVSPFYHVALYVAHVWTFIWIIMNSTRNRSIATSWRKNSMIGATVDISRMALAWVVVLQILGVDGLLWSTHRWSQNDLSLVPFFQNYWDPPILVASEVLVLRYAIGEMIQTSSVRSCSVWRFTKFGIFQEWIPSKPLLMHLSLSNYGQCDSLSVL